VTFSGSRSVLYGALRKSWRMLSAAKLDAPECLLFLEGPSCPAELKFDLGTQRQIIQRFYEAKGQSERALLEASSVADRKARLLREYPELLAAS
jgi:hypothetical protein